jgi:hypothetical protein
MYRRFLVLAIAAGCASPPAMQSQRPNVSVSHGDTVTANAAAVGFDGVKPPE